MRTISTHPFLFTNPQNPQNYLELFTLTAFGRNHKKNCTRLWWERLKTPNSTGTQENLEDFCIPALPDLRKWGLSSSPVLGTSWKREIQILFSYSISRRQYFSVSVSAWKGRNLNSHLSASWNDMRKCIFIRITANLGLKKEWDFPCVLYSAREVGQKQMHAC